MHVKRKVLNRISTIAFSMLLAVITHGLLCAPSTKAQTVTRTVQVTRFRILVGQPSWQSAIVNDISQSQFVFYPNGYFEFYGQQSNDVYRLTGEYQRNDDTVVFAALSESNSSFRQGLAGNFDLTTSVISIEMVLGDRVGPCLTATGCRYESPLVRYVADVLVSDSN